MQATFPTEPILLAVLTFLLLAAVMIAMLVYVRNKSDRDRRERYDFERNRAELDYLRKHFEVKIDDLSRKLEESSDRWRDVNHLLLSSQRVFEEKALVKPDVVPSDFLRSLGLDDAEDFQVDNRLVFYLTPFSDDYWATFATVRELCFELNLQAVRGDEQFVPTDILPVVIKQIVKSRFVIANITGRNPNVMYELGLAHAFGKPTILIAENLSDVPFDLNHKRIILFDDQRDLRNRLQKAIATLLIK